MSRRPPCSGLWETPTVHVSGALTTCCLDDQLLNELGNLARSTLPELWEGSRLRRWRIAQIEGRFQDSGPFCTRCNWRAAGSYPADRVRAYLERIGRTDVLERLEEALEPDAPKVR